MATPCSESDVPEIPCEHHMFTHVLSPVDYGTEEAQENIVTQLNAMLDIMRQTNVELTNTAFQDVAPDLPYMVRVNNGRQNEEIVKTILCQYGFVLEEVSQHVDMYRKIDFYVVGAFGRLSVQFKNRNVKKNSRRNDLGVEYCRVKFANPRTRRGGLEVHVGRDRLSVADVYLSIDPVNKVLHWMPTFLIERGAQELHNPYQIVVEQVPTTFHSPTGRVVIRHQWSISSRCRWQEIILQSDHRSLTLSDPNIGEIRYFRPYNDREGIFKAIFYMNDRFTGQYSYPLPR